jgi:hypothetical protein
VIHAASVCQLAVATACVPRSARCAQSFIGFSSPNKRVSFPEYSIDTDIVKADAAFCVRWEFNSVNSIC